MVEYNRVIKSLVHFRNYNKFIISVENSTVAKATFGIISSKSIVNFAIALQFLFSFNYLH